jgi:DNA-binding transcriptional MocR family regulator
MKRYEALANEVAASIASGQLQPGQRVPSVRETSRGRGVSPTTVFEAYYLLEARGLIEAQPLLADRFEKRALDLGYTPPPSLDNTRK